MNVSFTIGAEAANARNVAVQLKQTRFLDRNVGSKRALRAYLSTDAAGDTVINAATTGIVPTAGTAGKLLQGAVASEQAVFELKTNATGKVDVVLTNAGDEAETVYLNAVDPETGKVSTSAAIAFLDDTP